MPRKNSIVVRLVLVITLFNVVIFAVTLGYNYYQSRVILQNELESNARNLAMSLVNRVETQLTAVTKVTEGMARSLETGTYNEQELHDFDSEPPLKKIRKYTGSCVAFEPYAFNAASRCMPPITTVKMGRLPSGVWKNLIIDFPYPVLGLVPDSAGAGQARMERALFR